MNKRKRDSINAIPFLLLLVSKVADQLKDDR